MSKPDSMKFICENGFRNTDTEMHFYLLQHLTPTWPKQTE